MFRFATPYFLLLLILLPPTIWYRARRMGKAALSASSVHTAAGLAPSFALQCRRLLPLLFYLALILMIAGLARPQWGSRKIIRDTKGINIILAVDLSESMAALDFKLSGNVVNRLEAVKSVVNTFIRERDGDRIGMVVFGSQAYTQLPLTRDYNTITAILERLKIGAAGRSTAIGDAIGISLKRLEDIESRSNIIILLTDGRSNSGQLMPETAADIARKKKVKIYTIGVGGPGRAPFLNKDPIFGQRYVYRTVDFDAQTLQMIAEKTGGLYFQAEDVEGLKKIYDTIDAMEKTEVKVRSFDEYNDLYGYFLSAALTLLAAWVVLTHTRYLSIP